MVLLLYMGPVSHALGIWAAALWMVLAAVGMTLLMAGKSDEPPAPDCIALLGRTAREPASLVQLNNAHWWFLPTLACKGLKLGSIIA